MKYDGNSKKLTLSEQESINNAIKSVENNRLYRKKVDDSEASRHLFREGQLVSFLDQDGIERSGEIIKILLEKPDCKVLYQVDGKDNEEWVLFADLEILNR